MKTEEKELKKETVEEIKETVERKRELITFQVTPEEKRNLTVMAVKNLGISVSEFVRTKVFQKVEKKEETTEAINTTLADEERTIYEDKLKEQKEQIDFLKDELVNLKVTKAIVTVEETEEVAKENILVIELEPAVKTYIERIKKYREQEKAGLTDEKEIKEYFEFNKFMKTLLLRGLRRTYGWNQLNRQTGLKIADIEEMGKASEIDDFYI